MKNSAEKQVACMRQHFNEGVMAYLNVNPADVLCNYGPTVGNIHPISLFKIRARSSIACG
jgi:hypothetical protein